MKKILIIFLLLISVSLFYQCKESRHVTSQTTKTVVQSSKSIICNKDSSLCVHVDELCYPDGKASRFNIINTSSRDTVYTGNIHYQFIEWESNNTLKVRKIKGIEDQNPHTQIGRASDNIYFLLSLEDMKMRPVNQVAD